MILVVVIKCQFSSVEFFVYGVPSVSIKQVALRQCHVMWRTYKGDLSVKKKQFNTIDTVKILPSSIKSYHIGAYIFILAVTKFNKKNIN